MKTKRLPLLDFVNHKFHTPTWLFFVLSIVFILRIPSFFEPYSYGDEMIYLTLGEAIRRGIPLYSGIHDNKPPLLYIIAAISGSLFWFKAILAIWNILTIFLFWKLVQALFPKRIRLHKVVTSIFAILTTIPLLEGNIVNAELFMIGTTIAAFLVLLTRKLNFKNLFFAGMLFSFSALFKIPAAFDLPVIIFAWLIFMKKTARKDILKIGVSSLFLIAGFLTPILITFVWYYLRGAFNQYLVAAFLQNVGYLSSWRPSDVEKSFLVRNAPLLQRILVVLLGMVILYWKRGKLSQQFIFTTLWLLFSLFAVTLSERPYPHYLLQSVGPISILLGLLFSNKNYEQVLVIIPLTLAFFVPVYYKFWYYPTTTYYARFVKLSIGKITKEEYLSTFGNQVPRNYKIANYIISSSRPDDKIFVWGDSSPIYALARRLPPGKYVADYHIKDFSSPAETAAILTLEMPSFIVILPASQEFPEIKNLLFKNYGKVEEVEGAQIWKLLKPTLRGLNNFNFSVK